MPDVTVEAVRIMKSLLRKGKMNLLCQKFSSVEFWKFQYGMQTITI